MTAKRRFGRVRQLPSGRYQARYLSPEGSDRPAPYTFSTKRDAEVWLTLKEAEIKRGDWLDPSGGSMLFADYADAWLDQRELSPKTAQLYELLLRLHLNPIFGQAAIGAIRQEHVRSWRAARLRDGAQRKPPFGPVTVAKAYRLLRAILNTAVHDRRIRENPCHVKGADNEPTSQRPVLSVREVFDLADAIGDRYRALLLLATFGNLRWGELAGFRRRNLDLEDRAVRINETVYEFGQLVRGTPTDQCLPHRRRARNGHDEAAAGRLVRAITTAVDALNWADVIRAGEGNRTPTVSLGS
jgi:integrase